MFAVRSPHQWRNLYRFLHRERRQGTSYILMAQGMKTVTWGPEYERDDAVAVRSDVRCGIGRPFEACRDELAFQELVRRHGPMVIATARRIVQNSHDADDVFQATFLALATASLRHKVAVGSWLYRTAVRCGHSINRTKTAWDTKIKRKMERHEEKTFDPDAEPIRIVIDQELAKLPEKIRAAIVLCYLEGITRKEAAMRLGIPSPTLNDRIAKGKELLASRLVRRGVIGSVGGFTVYVKSLSKSAAQPMNPALVADISSKALQFSAGKPWSSVGVSEIVGHTATEVIKAMTSTKLVAICILALAIAMGLGYPLVSIFGITSSVASTQPSSSTRLMTGTMPTTRRQLGHSDRTLLVR